MVRAGGGEMAGSTNVCGAKVMLRIAMSVRPVEMGTLVRFNVSPAFSPGSSSASGSTRKGSWRRRKSGP